ncbi:hypothetical protein [Bacillus sp. Marseille-P3661]|uniref:hypothetical protein n=1 Tax=Bacillus sp. Marseille-P3661 TaxID=1936234 RepID=UPI000C81AA3D|nr:hypothetical protein [Bacillus sp. Marseille-P3661]
MNKLLLKLVVLLLALSIAVFGCNRAEENQEPVAENPEKSQEETIPETPPTAYSEEQMMTVSHDILNVWYVERLGAATREELEPVYDIFKDPAPYVTGIEAFFDNGIAGLFDDIKLETDNEKVMGIDEKSFYYQGDVTVSGHNKETDKVETFNETVKMAIEEVEEGSFKIHTIQAEMKGEEGAQ